MDLGLKISPSLLAADFGRLDEELGAIEAAGAEMLHLDVMDGHFVPNISFGPPVIKALRPKTRLFFDVHLMITDPMFFLDSIKEAGADGITVHYESCGDGLGQIIEAIHHLGCKAGVSLKPATPAEVLFPYLAQIDLALVMTVEPGFGGQVFQEEQIPKIAALRRAAPHLDIQVDGGITAKTAPLVRAAGANILVAGTAIFGQTDYQKAVHSLRGKR